MNDSNWEDQFCSYDIDFIKGKNSTEAEQIPSVDKESLPQEPVITEHDEPKTEPESVENVYTESSETIASREKVKENKERYDRLLSRFSNQEPRILKKEDVENAVTLMDECITASHQLQNTTETPADRRLVRKRRIVAKQLSAATDVFMTAKYMGACFIDVDQSEYYQYLDDCHFVLMVSQASRTFRTNSAKIFESATAQQSKDAIDKISVSAERLAMTLAEVINSFPGENGATALLEKMVDKGDDDAIDCISRTIQMAAKRDF